MKPFADNLTIGEVLEGLAKIAFALLKGTALEEAENCFKKRKEEQLQQESKANSLRQSVSTTPPPPTQTPLVKTSTVTTIPKQCLLLVISATQAEFLDSLQAKGQIDMSDGERLYEITKYLWLGSETDFSESVSKACINQYSVSEGEKSEYDICLVSIELNESSKGFEPNVNQLDRYDAFRNLADLKINFLSPRLQMEAYGNFEVYNR